MAFWSLCAVCGRRVVPFDPFEDDILNTLAAPSLTHWFGTDQLGRDVLSRVIVGARDILLVAPLATALGVALGVILGLVTGYFRGITDDVIGRLIDALLALPLVIIALLALTAIGPSSLAVIVVIGVIFAPLVARTVRAAVLSSAISTMWPRRGCATSTPCTSCSRKSCPMSFHRSWSRPASVWAMPSSRSRP